MTCVESWELGLFGASLFLGWSITLLWLPSFADRYGRKPFFWAAMVLDVALYVGLLFTHNMIVMICIWFTFGLLTSLRTNVGYVYLMELLPKRVQTAVTSGWNVQESVIYVLGTLYFWKISTHWIYFTSIGFVWCVISAVLMIWVPESPRFLVNAGNLKAASKSLQFIAKLNRVPAELNAAAIGEKLGLSLAQKQERRTEDEAQGIDEGASEAATPKVSYFLSQRKILTNLIIMSIAWLTSSFCYYLVLSLVNTFDKVYVSGLTSSVSEMIAYIVSGLFYEKVGVKLSLILAFAISAFGGVMILAYGLAHEDSVAFFIFFLLAKFGVTCTFNINFAANSYFFPVLFCATAMGICNFLARLSSAFSFIVGQIEEPIPMYLFTGLCITSIVALFFLRTDGAKSD